MIKNIYFDRDAKKLFLNDAYCLNYCNEDSAKQTLDELCATEQYEFNCEKNNPFIIDCGSEIGIATFIFKIQYPQAKILCFEPDPKGFYFLQKNVNENKLQNVTLVNAAIGTQDGTVDFFGQLNVDNPDLRGNSTIPVWGIQRSYFDCVKVKVVKLSTYINETVDLLKLDVEGVEQSVLEELGGKLPFVKRIVMEVHQCAQMKAINDLDKIEKILLEHNFDVEIIAKNADFIWPEVLSKWVNEVQPSLYNLKAQLKD